MQPADDVHYYHSSNAFDGSLSQVLSSGSCFHSRHESNPWLIVDLGGIYIIKHVAIYNRIDYRSYRLHNAVIDVSNYIQFNETKLCTEFDNINDPTQIETFNCAKIIREQFVRLYMNAIEYLQICEMQVYGYM